MSHSTLIVEHETPTEHDLQVLAGNINDLDARAKKCAKDAINHAYQCGRWCIQAKRTVGHGEFLPWLRVNCPNVSDRQVRRYMMLARGWDHVAKLDAMSDLTITMATKLIARAQRKSKDGPVAITGEPCECDSPERMTVVNDDEFVCRCGGTMPDVVSDEDRDRQGGRFYTSLEKLSASTEPLSKAEQLRLAECEAVIEANLSVVKSQVEDNAGVVGDEHGETFVSYAQNLYGDAAKAMHDLQTQKPTRATCQHAAKVIWRLADLIDQLAKRLGLPVTEAAQ